MFHTDNKFYYISLDNARRLPVQFRENLVKKEINSHDYAAKKSTARVSLVTEEGFPYFGYTYYLHNLTPEDHNMLKLLDIYICPIQERDLTSIDEYSAVMEFRYDSKR